MSYYFRPPNSREQNLYIIRLSIDDLYITNFNNNVLKDSAYTSPAKIFLPANFSLNFVVVDQLRLTGYFIIDYTNAKYEIPPSVIISVLDDNINTLPKGWNISIKSTSTTQCLFYMYYIETTVNPDFTTTVRSVLPSLDILFKTGIQIQIIGRTITGPTFAIANQGWTYVESNDQTSDTIYTSMNVGTNGVIPPFALTLGGTYGYYGGGGGGIESTSSLQNYTPTDVVNNINNYSFFPIVLGSTSEVLILPVITTANIGQQIKLVLNQNLYSSTLTISTTNTSLSSQIVFTNEGDTVTFVGLAKDGNPSRWVKINNL